MADKEADGAWALKLLTTDAEKEQSLLGGYIGTIIAGPVATISVLFSNYASGRPAWSGVHKHIAIPLAAMAVVRWYELHVASDLAERDAVLRHYITLHPEDFPAPERKKLSDLFLPWIPVR